MNRYSLQQFQFVIKGEIGRVWGYHPQGVRRWKPPAQNRFWQYFKQGRIKYPGRDR
jgi:hypothetical protein